MADKVSDMGDDGNNADFYRPLDSENVEFRLLLLQAGKGDEPVKCQLVHASLKDGTQDRPPYETISYCWGDASEKGAIFLDGLEMVVPLSSATVLRRMRKPEEDRTVWIDAICINQDDVDERGKQVALMKEIYSKTAQNLIWLGEGNDEATEYCFIILTAAYMHAKIETDNFAHFDDITSRTISTSGLGFPILKHHLIEFFSSPWFERVWVSTSTGGFLPEYVELTSRLFARSYKKPYWLPKVWSMSARTRWTSSSSCSAQRGFITNHPYLTCAL